MNRKLQLFSLALMISFIAAGQHTDTTHFTIIMAGLDKGFSKTWKNADGSFTDWFQYNDRGRGDSTRTIYRLDENGIPTYLKMSGVDYMKNPVEEEFSLSNGVAKWKNVAENEEKKVEGAVYFLGLKSYSGNFYRALKAHNNQLALLPYGTVSMQTLRTETIGKGSSAKKVHLVSITGLGMTPNYSWVDENYMDFASVSDWFSSIRKGYEQDIARLLAIQKEYQNSYFNDLAKRLPVKTTTVLIRNVNLFDAVKAIMINDADVLVENGRIKQVSPGKRINTSAAKVIDGKGMTLLPGLWDMHVHMSSDVDGILHMAAGVTHVRDMGNDSTLLTRIKKIKGGSLIGPDIDIMSGFIDGAGPLAAPTGALINSEDEGIKAIQDYAKKGYQQIKLYSSIKPQWVKRLAAEAHKNKMKVSGHIPAFMTAEQAIEAGYDEITHMNMLALNFFGDTVDTRSPNRFRLPAMKTAGLDLQGSEMKRFIQLLKTKNIAVDPTLGVFESLFTARDGIMEERYETIIHRFPATSQRSIRAGGGGLPVPEGMNETFLQSNEAFLKIARMLFDNGIRIVAGTDGVAGFDLHRELELYVKAGIPAEKVLQLASYGTAEYIGKQKTYGSVEAGRSADFIMVQGNPMENISDIRNTRWVMKGSQLYESGKLYEAIAIKEK